MRERIVLPATDYQFIVLKRLYDDPFSLALQRGQVWIRGLLRFITSLKGILPR